MTVPSSEIEWRGVRDMRGLCATQRDRVLFALAADQHGVVSHGQLLERGFSEDMIDRLRKSGRLVELHRHVYAVGHARLRPEGHLLAAQLACGAEAVLGGRSATHVHGVLEDRRAVWDVIVPANQARGRRLPRIKVYRCRLEPQDVTVIDGLRVTSLARSLVDLGAYERERHVHTAVEQALVLRTYDQWTIDEILRRPGHLRGVGVLRRVLEERHPDAHLTRSELERAALTRLRGAGVPRPRVNEWLSDVGLEIDLFWPDEGLAVELDGRRYHGHRRARDAERDRRLAAIGLRVLRFGWGDVTAGPFPDQVQQALLNR